jgi:nitroimidazol reductase NimA-like FMN-containing flavoprotein (pyridoxamine 5'-phosphate oxidase superfamily)
MPKTLPKAKSSQRKVSHAQAFESGQTRVTVPAEVPNLVRVSRPQAPATYGFKKPEKYLAWTHVEERLANSRNYWICTARSDGRPHSIPVWGIWVDGAFYFGTARSSRKARNLSQNPALSVHLDSGDDVVILEGTAKEVPNINQTSTRDQALFTKLNKASQSKYKMPLVIEPESVFYCLQPRVVLAWTEKDFPNNATGVQTQLASN